MTCPVCGEKTSATTVISLIDHTVRRRQCKVCKHIFYTEEAECKSAQIEFVNYYREAARKKIAEKGGKKK